MITPRYCLRHSIHHGYYAYDTERKAAAMRFGSPAGDRGQYDAACDWIAKANRLSTEGLPHRVK